MAASTAGPEVSPTQRCELGELFRPGGGQNATLGACCLLSATGAEERTQIESENAFMNRATPVPEPRRFALTNSLANSRSQLFLDQPPSANPLATGQKVSRSGETPEPALCFR